MKPIKIGCPVTYKDCFILPVNDGFDVVDKRTGKWVHFSSQRLAKWNATVWTRLSKEFDDSKSLSNKKMTYLQAMAVAI
jgi:hypothetical protein